MDFNRRRVVQLGTAVTVGTMLPRMAAGQREDFETDLGSTLTRFRAKFGALGFDESAALPILTGDASYNGGLRHDFDQSALPFNSFVIQPLARVSDVEEKSRADVLPLFHEVGCHPAGADGQTTTELMMRLLIDDFTLDPSRIAFVSVPLADELRPVLDDMGLSFAEKVLLRDEAGALAARDASGFFFPDPFDDDYVVTMGVYYRVGNVDEPAPKTYPPSANWTEIGEIVIAGDAAPLGISIGAERLVYAITGQYPTWEQRLGALFAQVEEEGTEPPGLTAFR
ncbi:hypothetical protein [Ruegeria sp. MALMAid1280]|uniref:hypothetical protein n=1 Tax=Ruegeria sp. MALMAid1280 TaxID=3411634 RepID=UPI003BA31D43